MSAIAVCPLSKLDKTLQETGATHVISLLSGATEFTRPDNIDVEKHLILRFNDITEARDGLVSPTERHIFQLAQFAEKWDRQAPLLVHCWAGISRSPAAAVIIALALNPVLDEQKLAITLRQLSASITPNIMMIKLADVMLERGGKLTRAMKNIGRGKDAFEGEPFVLRLIPRCEDINPYDGLKLPT